MYNAVAENVGSPTRAAPDPVRRLWYKHIDEITRDDRQARIESENAKAAWIQDRLRRQPRPQ
jgi:hypothetical protein